MLLFFCLVFWIYLVHLKSVLNNSISGTDLLKSKCFNPENLEVNLFDFYNQTRDSVGMPNLGVQSLFLVIFHGRVMWLLNFLDCVLCFLSRTCGFFFLKSWTCNFDFQCRHFYSRRLLNSRYILTSLSHAIRKSGIFLLLSLKERERIMILV